MKKADPDAEAADTDKKKGKGKAPAAKRGKKKAAPKRYSSRLAEKFRAMQS